MMFNSVGFPFRFSEEIKIRRNIQSVFNAVCEKNGFEEIECPLISSLDELVGPAPLPLQQDHLNRVFHGILLQGQNTTNGALRYEGTTAIASLLAKMDFQNKNRYSFHYFQEMVRLEKQEELCEKRQKSFFQLGVENFSVSHKDHLIQTSKMLKLITEFLFSLNLTPKIRLAHVSIVHENFKDVVFEPILKRRVIDLMEKGTYQMLEQVLRKMNLTKTATDSLIKMAQLRDVPLSEGISYVKSLNLENAYYDLKTVYDDLLSKGVDDSLLYFDAGIHRSLNFYSGIIFQLDCENMNEIAGGGEFSKLIKHFDPTKEVYSMGLAIGYERLLIAQKQKQKALC